VQYNKMWCKIILHNIIYHIYHFHFMILQTQANVLRRTTSGNEDEMKKRDMRLTRYQSHKHFTCSFYACRTQKRKNDWLVFFTLLGFAGIKIVHWWNWVKVSIAPTYYKQLSQAQIPKAVKLSVFSALLWSVNVKASC